MYGKPKHAGAASRGGILSALKTAEMIDARANLPAGNTNLLLLLLV